MPHIALVLVIVSLSSEPAQTPSLFRERSISPRTLAQAVNHYVSVGEDVAVKELNAIAAESRSDFGRAIRTAERIGWLCRILYQPKGTKPLRAALLGGLTLDFKTQPLEDWPLYPVAASGPSFFVLAKWSWIAGMPESAEEYLEYCRRNGRFRKTTIPLPTRDQAREDAVKLRQSKAWKSIDWREVGRSHGGSKAEESSWNFIKAQADAIPPRSGADPASGS